MISSLSVQCVCTKYGRHTLAASCFCTWHGLGVDCTPQASDMSGCVTVRALAKTPCCGLRCVHSLRGPRAQLGVRPGVPAGRLQRVLVPVVYQICWIGSVTSRYVVREDAAGPVLLAAAVCATAGLLLVLGRRCIWLGLCSLPVHVAQSEGRGLQERAQSWERAARHAPCTPGSNPGALTVNAP